MTLASLRPTTYFDAVIVEIRLQLDRVHVQVELDRGDLACWCGTDVIRIGDLGYLVEDQQEVGMPPELAARAIKDVVLQRLGTTSRHGMGGNSNGRR